MDFKLSNISIKLLVHHQAAIKTVRSAYTKSHCVRLCKKAENLTLSGKRRKYHLDIQSYMNERKRIVGRVGQLEGRREHNISKLP